MLTLIVPKKTIQNIKNIIQNQCEFNKYSNN